MPHLTDTTSLDDLPKPAVQFTYSELLALDLLVRIELADAILSEGALTKLEAIQKKIETARYAVPA